MCSHSDFPEPLNRLAGDCTHNLRFVRIFVQGIGPKLCEYSRTIAVFQFGKFFAFPHCKETLAMLPPSTRSINQSPARTLDIILRSTLSLVECYGPSVHESTTLNDLKFAFRSTIAELQMIDAVERERSTKART